MSEQPRSERELIRRIGRLLAPPGFPPPPAGSVPFGDDMAAIPGTDLLWTTDMLMDGVDFKSHAHGWAAIGRKAMAVNLSDCAAMGATPLAALCAVALNDGMSMAAALELIAGIRDCGAAFGCPLVGGDTNSWKAPLVISISVAARCASAAGPPGRRGARPGDGIWLSGPVGGSILGRHLAVEPRVELGRQIVRKLRPHAMMDVSDGLALDLDRILEASRCGAVLERERLLGVIHPDAERLSARDGRPALEHALHDGEDFELLVVLAPEDAGAAGELGLLFIGRIVSESGLWIGEGGVRHPLSARGWEHFTRDG